MTHSSLSDQPLVSARGIAMRYGTGPLSTGVLEEMDFTAQAGEFVVVLGRSGSGKSTLLNLLGGMDRPLAGTIRIGDEELTAMDEEGRARFRRRAIGFVFQTFNLLPTLTVAENLALPLALNQRSERTLVSTMLARLGLADRAERYPDQLPGGEQQRVASGRALIHSPSLVLADEPTGNLDADTSRQVLALFTDLVRERGTTLVMATHSSEPQALADRLLRLDHGRLVDLA
jgi:putative ABC transport system ATP-binding protein